MGKPKIQPPAPLHGAVPDILGPLGLAHAGPRPVLLPVPPDIVALGGQEQDDRREVDGQQRRVAAPVVGFVVVAVDEAVGDVAELDRDLWGR